jgi:hypothetical protein
MIRKPCGNASKDWFEAAFNYAYLDNKPRLRARKEKYSQTNEIYLLQVY